MYYIMNVQNVGLKLSWVRIIVQNVERCWYGMKNNKYKVDLWEFEEVERIWRD